VASTTTSCPKVPWASEWLVQNASWCIANAELCQVFASERPGSSVRTGQQQRNLAGGSKAMYAVAAVHYVQQVITATRRLAPLRLRWADCLPGSECVQGRKNQEFIWQL
jgi:hypothetical protein